MAEQRPLPSLTAAAGRTSDGCETALVVAEHTPPASLEARCPVCLEAAGAQGGDAGLSCGHGFCASCAAHYVESLVDTGRVSSEELCCPRPECRRPMEPDLLARLLRGPAAATVGGERLLHRLLDFQARRFVPEAGDGERLVACPTASCGKLLVPQALVEARETIVCPECAQAFCAACSLPAHAGSTCEDAELAELGRLDPALRRLIENETWTRCPACRSLCERESGCNFMTCPSEDCRGKTHFCYLCGELLAASDHAGHFEGFEGAVGSRGPFGSMCQNRREENLATPSRPPPPSLSVVEGDDEGSIALRLTWGEHRSEPPTIYYKVRVVSTVGHEARLTAQAGYGYHDVKPGRHVQKLLWYHASVTPVNVNGVGPESETSEEVHFHPRELAARKARELERERDAAVAPPRGKRWATR